MWQMQSNSSTVNSNHSLKNNVKFGGYTESTFKGMTDWMKHSTYWTASEKNMFKNPTSGLESCRACKVTGLKQRVKPSCALHNSSHGTTDALHSASACAVWIGRLAVSQFHWHSCCSVLSAPASEGLCESGDLQSASFTDTVVLFSQLQQVKVCVNQETCSQPVSLTQMFFCSFSPSEWRSVWIRRPAVSQLHPSSLWGSSPRAWGGPGGGGTGEGRGGVGADALHLCSQHEQGHRL